MQHFMIPCDFGGRKAPFPIYVGEPKIDAHPLHYQAWWLSSERGGSIPQEVMDSFEKLHTIAKENNVSFEELCVYAMNEATAQDAASAQPQVQAPPHAPDSSEQKSFIHETNQDRLETERSEIDPQPSQG